MAAKPPSLRRERPRRRIRGIPAKTESSASEVADPLIVGLLSEAAVLRKWGCTELASAVERMAAEFQNSRHQEAQVALTLEEASQIGGYSASHIGRLVRSGKIPNAGRTGAPRVAYADVPRKSLASASVQRQVDAKQIVRLAIKRS